MEVTNGENIKQNEFFHIIPLDDGPKITYTKPKDLGAERRWELLQRALSGLLIISLDELTKFYAETLNLPGQLPYDRRKYPLNEYREVRILLHKDTTLPTSGETLKRLIAAHNSRFMEGGYKSSRGGKGNAEFGPLRPLPANPTGVPAPVSPPEAPKLPEKPYPEYIKRDFYA